MAGAHGGRSPSPARCLFGEPGAPNCFKTYHLRPEKVLAYRFAMYYNGAPKGGAQLLKKRNVWWPQSAQLLENVTFGDRESFGIPIRHELQACPQGRRPTIVKRTVW